MSVYDRLFNLGERGPGLLPAGIIRQTPPTYDRFGSIVRMKQPTGPIIGTVRTGKLALGWNKI